jgi:predicted ATP-dependent endonuclease of OLD family
MKYSEFRFENFKGIGELSLKLTGPVTTLVGLNESGKTTILEAIFCFTYGAENLDALDPSMASLREPERWIPIASRGNFNDTIKIVAVISLDEQDTQKLKTAMRRDLSLTITKIPTQIEITESYVFENSRPVPDKSKKTWNLHVEGTTGLQKVPRGLSGDNWRAVVNYLKDNLPSIWYFPNFLFELPDRFLLEEDPTAAPSADTDKSLFYRQMFDAILGSMGTGANLDTHILNRVKSETRADQRNLKSLLLQMSREVTKTVFEGWNRIFGRALARQEVEIDADVDENGKAFLDLKIKGPDGYYDLSERSLGFRWFFMFLLMTSYRGLSERKPGVVFLLDEPASNLHSSAQAELLKSFEQLAQTCHIVYTTHSHHMINLKWLDSAYVIKNEAVGEFSFEEYLTTHAAAHTAISATPYRTFVAENPSHTSYFQPVLDLLEYRPSNLEPIPNVVLVEGKSDFYLFRYFTDILSARPALHLVPGGGAGSLDTLIGLHIGWGKAFLILLDGDSEGQVQRARYEDKFGSLAADRIFLLGDVCADPTVREAEDLLNPTDREALISAIFSPGVPRPKPKKALYQAVIELYSSGTAVAVDPATLERFSRVLTSLEGELQTQGTN